MPLRDLQARAAYNRMYRERRREELNARARDWHHANREYANECSRAYYRANRDAALLQARARYAADPETVRVRVKSYNEAKPHVKQAAHARRRRSERANGRAVMSSADVKDLRDSADSLCAYCLQSCAKPVVEHCIPLARGGTNTIDNCVMACRSCNARKHTKTPLEFLCGLPQLGAF